MGELFYPRELEIWASCCQIFIDFVENSITVCKGLSKVMRTLAHPASRPLPCTSSKRAPAHSASTETVARGMPFIKNGLQ